MNGNHDGDSAALVVQQDEPQFVTESFRSTLASILRNQASGRPQKIILVTSPGPSEGKTTVVQNLGIVLAETGRRVLLVDADFRRPHLHRKFGLPNEWGLIDLLCEDLPLNEYPPERLETPTGTSGPIDSSESRHAKQCRQSALLAPIAGHPRDARASATT